MSEFRRKQLTCSGHKAHSFIYCVKTLIKLVIVENNSAAQATTNNFKNRSEFPLLTLFFVLFYLLVESLYYTANFRYGFSFSFSLHILCCCSNSGKIVLWQKSNLLTNDEQQKQQKYYKTIEINWNELSNKE